MFNRRLFLFGATAILGGCAARATALQPQSTGMPYASPGAQWTGAARSGVTPPTDPVRTTFKPTAHFLTVSDQVMAGADFTVHVMARAPGGIQSVEFFHENPTTTVVTASQLNTITKADGATKVRDTYAIKLKWADWSAAPSKIAHTSANTGIFIYARVTANPYKGVTPQPRVIGPINVIPRAALNDLVVTVSASGKDSTSATLPNATYPGATYTTLNAALDAIYAMNHGSLDPVAAWGAMPCSPKIVLAETAFYPLVSTGVPGFGTGRVHATMGWSIITAAPGVTATIGRTSAPNYTNQATWYWVPPIGHICFRGPGLVMDHRNFSYVHMGRGVTIPVGSGVVNWLDGCKQTTSAPAKADIRGFSSPLYNTEWNLGPHPAIGYQTDFGNGSSWMTDNHVEFLDSGTYNNDPLNDGCTFQTIQNSFFQVGGSATDCILHTYSNLIDTRFFEPDQWNSFHVTYTGATNSLTFAQDRGTSGGAGLTIKLNGVTKGSVVFGQDSSQPYYTWTQVKAWIDSLAIPNLTVTVDDNVENGGLGRYKAPYFVGFGSENGFSDTFINGTVQFIAFPAVHTEWMHSLGSGSDGNVLCYGNVTRNCMFGTATIYDERGLVDSWFANNVFMTIAGTTNVSLGPMNYGSNVTAVHNLDDSGLHINFGSPVRTGDAISQLSNNLFNQVQDTTAALVETVSYNINTGTDLSGVTVNGSAGNLAPVASFSAFTAMFRNYASGDFRATISGLIDTNKAPPAEKYDMFYNLRPARDWVGPISSAQSSAPVWPF